MPEAHVLVVNCGSSSIKLALLEPTSGTCLWRALAERVGSPDARLQLTPATGERRSIELPGADHERALEVALTELPALPLPMAIR